jgi:hypothetical protein
MVEEWRQVDVLLQMHQIVQSLARQDNSDHSYFVLKFVKYYPVHPSRDDVIHLAIHRRKRHPNSANNTTTQEIHTGNDKIVQVR